MLSDEISQGDSAIAHFVSKSPDIGIISIQSARPMRERKNRGPLDSVSEIVLSILTLSKIHKTIQRNKFQ